MNCKCAHFWSAISLISVFLTILAQAEPNLYNGKFELFDANGGDFNTPTGWQHKNYTAVISNFIPYRPWLLPEEGLVPFEGDYFVMLSTGDMYDTDPNYAQIWQTITVDAGDKLTGVYFFGTYDYMDFNDFAEIKLVPSANDPNI
jgi:hypothetical protein